MSYAICSQCLIASPRGTRIVQKAVSAIQDGQPSRLILRPEGWPNIVANWIAERAYQSQEAGWSGSDRGTPDAVESILQPSKNGGRTDQWQDDAQDGGCRAFGWLAHALEWVAKPPAAESACSIAPASTR
jgi:hypothetical protein